MLVNEHTKIAALLKHHPQALEALVSINPKFKKLRNPILRRLMAGRTSIGMAAKVAGCAEEAFFRALSPLGFELEPTTKETEIAATPMPAILQSVKAEQLVSLDVRPILARGNDPLKEIMAAVKALQPGEVLKIINTFEPTPLVVMLKKKGFQSWTRTTNHHHLETFFFRQSAAAMAESETSPPVSNNNDWYAVRERFAGCLLEIDVRALEMPQPMIHILEALDRLPPEHALYVVHKRMPVYLLPELSQRNFNYRSRPLADDEVHLLIFRN